MIRFVKSWAFEMDEKYHICCNGTLECMACNNKNFRIDPSVPGMIILCDKCWQQAIKSGFIPIELEKLNESKWHRWWEEFKKWMCY